ncbi:hypothetical protein [Hyphomicrobium sp.]|uniref:hypothetical protein n=1 Tax=Hyphomicrobium sp. TaxID=82 RepID=UPI0025C07A89|nr:hypothetical protein [Hyphomicrobium sp.]MCC7252882.1 hypothetical protein [Hyphomicrobium sp.]
MTPELQAIVDEAYRVFGRYEITTPTLTVCNCNCCMTVEIERELIKTPLREIPSDVLAEYTNSAHGWDDGPIAREMRYFLPRYLELIALDDPPDNMGIDICLRRLGYAKWREKWPDDEVQLLDRFLDAFLVASLDKIDLVVWPVGWCLDFDLGDVLSMIVTAGGNLDRALAAWDGAADPAAAIHMAALRDDVLTLNGRPCFNNAFLEKHREEADRIGAFLMRPEVDQRLEAAFFAVEDPRLQQILSDAMP